MNQIELIVGLKVPDTVAITVFHTLEKLGFAKLKRLKMEDYYKFSTTEPISKFSKKIGKVDILVNANKNKFIVKSEKEPFEEEISGQSPETSEKQSFSERLRNGKAISKSLSDKSDKKEDNLFIIKILVKDREDGAKAILKTLQERLGFSKIKKLEKGTLWTLYIAAQNEDIAKLMAKEISWKLLFNEHYQECKML